MKHSGNNMVLAKVRAHDLMVAYHDYINMTDHISLFEAYRAAVNSQAPRFYVTAKRAAIVLSQMQRKGICCGNPLRNEMYHEIQSRCNALRSKHPDWNLYQLCADVVMQPAPKFYITSEHAQSIIIKARRQWAKEKLKRLHLYGSL